MANCMSTTSARLPKGAPSFNPTPAMQHFRNVMHDLSTYIEVERDIEHSGSCLAGDAWIRDAGSARTRTLDSLAKLDATPLERHEDQPLKRLGKMARMLIESDTPEASRNTFALQAYFPDLFHPASISSIGRRSNQSMAAFQPHLHTLSELPDFMDAIEADHAEINRDDPIT